MWKCVKKEKHLKESVLAPFFQLRQVNLLDVMTFSVLKKEYEAWL